MNPTEQQFAIENLDLRGITRVEARAGTGKTSSLVGLAKAQSIKGMRGLYLAFTKASEIDAVGRFPRGVICKTINALAYAIVGREFEHKLREHRATDVLNALSLESDWEMAKIVLDIIDRWCHSDQPELPSRLWGSGLPPIRAARAATLAKAYWNMMCDIDNRIVPMTHSGYLKLFALSKPTLAFDYIMLDEEQDTNPVTWSILRHQQAPLILVGDEYQSIFKFRGAVNAKAQMPAHQTLSLTQSFRFGSGVANIANALLQAFYEENVLLQGVGQDSDVGIIDKSIPYAIIARTNAEIFSCAVQALHDRKKLAFVGKITSYGFARILDVWHLKSGARHEMRDSFLRGFSSFMDLQEYADGTEDPEVKRLVKLVDTYGASLVQLVPAIHNAATSELEDADVVLTTAHKSKGLTLPYVVLAEDFPDLVEGNRLLTVDELDLQEVNLYYVAVTRASHGLQLNSTCKDFLRVTGKPFTHRGTAPAYVRPSIGSKQPRTQMQQSLAVARLSKQTQTTPPNSARGSIHLG